MKKLIFTGLACAVGGAIVRSLFPPFILDDPFWREFFTGPPVAGFFALVGAGVAYLAARVGSRSARIGAERQEWWDRAEWALNLARSDQSIDRLIGLKALQPLTENATYTEYEMILAVVEAVTGDNGDAANGDVDNEKDMPDNEGEGGAEHA
ncbi:hypothetical protein CVV68_01185 [Arthrobacter livingstonensis]|uniref:Uncharacterized protein n=1 Tax=Arthrobacter livingstonensis TaxID=670078 RepID=A0A2V5LFA1_9MICC|nr:hypothetical protein [Arthrobacter livingstonensis]PYI69752.1 hypothetical protein CVV68_01185 [Arthrobacter livingstonensis]